jgi:hypothetical protein
MFRKLYALKRMITLGGVMKLGIIWASPLAVIHV